MTTLVVDASTYRGTVAVFRGHSLIASAEAAMRGLHSESLMPTVAETLSRAGIEASSISRVICGEGPGSFTSLRIAASIAKGICHGRGIPLFAVSSLGLAAAAAEATGTFVVTIDALRDEWYAATFERTSSGAVVQRSPMSIVKKSEIDAYAAGVGPIIANAEPHAAACAAMLGDVERRGPVSLESWEPAYGRLAEAQVKWEAAHGRPLKA